MALKVFDTYHAPDAEIDGVKHALDAAKLPWFETHKGRWWVGSAAIWVSDEGDYAKAREAIDDFQRTWENDAKLKRTPFSSTDIRWSRIPIFLLVLLIILYFSSFWLWLPSG